MPEINWNSENSRVLCMLFAEQVGMWLRYVLAVCDFDMRFTYVAVGQPGSLHDTSVLYHALEADVDVFPHLPQGKYFFLRSFSYLYAQTYLVLHMCRQVLCCRCGLSKSFRVPSSIQG